MKRGFTLVELLATMIVLSIVAVIVVPNIKKNVKEVQEGLNTTQLQSIKEAAENWASDNIDLIPSINNESIYVFLKELKSGGYTYGDLYKDENGNMFNDYIFVLITCNVISSDENNNSNYKYSYNVYDTNDKHLSYLANLYAQKNNVTSRTTVTLSNLLPFANKKLLICGDGTEECTNTNIDSNTKLKNIEDGSLISNATVVIDYNNGEYSFRVNIS